MTPITHRNREIERLEGELAAKDTQITKLTAQLRAVKDFNKVHQEQHAQSRENAKLLYTTLRRAAPDVLKGIEGALWQNTTEYDKLMSEGRRWQDKFQRSELELAESREECRRLRELLDKVLTGTGNLLSNHADFVNYVYPHGFKVDKPDEEFALDLRLEVIELGRNAFDLSVNKALAPKAGDK